MKKFFSFSLIAIVPFMNLCSHEEEVIIPKNNFIIRTINGMGKPIPAEIIYEFQDCEYDFLNPSHIHTDEKGLAMVSIPDQAYIQFYAKGYLHESYKCFNDASRPKTITIFAAPIPTYIKTNPGAEVNYFPNTAGDCEYEAKAGKLLKADSKGNVTLFLPLQETYKIQSAGKVKCFQPDQEIHTLEF